MLQILDAYNRKERNYVANYCLSNKYEGSLELNQNFITEIEKSINTPKAILGKEYFASLEFNFDWLYASLYEYNNGISPKNPILLNGESFFKGSYNSDTDLLIVVKDENKYDFYFIEAKYKSGWDEAQINKKINLMEEAFRQNPSSDIGSIYYIFYSDSSSKNNLISSYSNRNMTSFSNFKGFFEISVNPTNNNSIGTYQSLVNNISIESSILAQHAINGNFDFDKIGSNLDKEFLNKNILLNKNNSYFAATDYIFYNLYRSFGLNTVLNSLNNLNKRTDIDFLFVQEKTNGGYIFVFLEAKAYTGWKKEQLEQKLEFINDFVAKRQNNNDEYYFLTLAIKNPKSSIIARVNNIANLNYHPCILTIKTPRYRTQRCNPAGTASQAGTHWIKRED